MIVKPDTTEPAVSTGPFTARSQFIAACVCWLVAWIVGPWLDLPVATWFHHHGFIGDLRKMVSYAEVFGHGWESA